MTWVMHSLVRGALTELSDAEYQARVWTASGGPEIGSLTEATARLFDDSGLGDALTSDDPVYGTEADNLLRALDARLGKLDDARSPAEILGDPTIEDVRRLAAAALRALPPDVGEPGG
jgi:hypothetical protein